MSIDPKEKVRIDPERGLVYTFDQLGNVHDDNKIRSHQWLTFPFAIKKEGDNYYLVSFDKCPDFVRHTLLKQI